MTPAADVWVEAGRLGVPIHVHKLSVKTNLIDVGGRKQEMPEGMYDELRANKKRIGEVWRAKVGDQRRWRYGWSAEKALKLALHNGAVS